MKTPEQLSESLLAACKAAGIEKPKYIMQGASEAVYHSESDPRSYDGRIYSIRGIRIDHPPYATDWRDSLMEWVDHVADVSKMIDDACEIAYQKHLEKGDGLCWSRAGDYRQGWQDALAWKGGQP